MGHRSTGEVTFRLRLEGLRITQEQGAGVSGERNSVGEPVGT